MKNSELVKAVNKIANRLLSGDLNNLSKIDLTCPKCEYSPLIFSYAINRPGRYGFYIYCQNCKLLHHFTLHSKPPNFRDDLILPQFQKLENEAMGFADSFSDKLDKLDSMDKKEDV